MYIYYTKFNKYSSYIIMYCLYNEYRFHNTTNKIVDYLTLKVFF